jgi:hypothetical protein
MPEPAQHERRMRHSILRASPSEPDEGFHDKLIAGVINLPL